MAWDVSRAAGLMVTFVDAEADEQVPTVATTL